MDWWFKLLQITLADAAAPRALEAANKQKNV